MWPIKTIQDYCTVIKCLMHYTGGVGWGGFPCYVNFNSGMLQPECSKMKANCLQIFVLGALTPVKMQTRGKNLAKSLTEQRKKLRQESSKQEPSFHLSWCQNELRQLSWGNTESLGKHTACTVPRWTRAERQGQGPEPWFSSHLPPPGGGF